VNIADFAPIENARIAFGARTGGANANQFIDNFSIVPWEAVPTISTARNTDGSITVTFEGKLQTGPTVNGPWTDSGATSPATLSPDGDKVFGRAVSD